MFRIIDVTDVTRRSKLVLMEHLSLQCTPGGKAQLKSEEHTSEIYYATVLLAAT